MSALHDAVRDGMDIKAFNKLLKKKSVSLNHQEGDTLQAPLHLACSEVSFLSFFLSLKQLSLLSLSLSLSLSLPLSLSHEAHPPTLLFRVIMSSLNASSKPGPIPTFEILVVGAPSIVVVSLGT